MLIEKGPSISQAKLTCPNTFYTIEKNGEKNIIEQKKHVMDSHKGERLQTMLLLDNKLIMNRNIKIFIVMIRGHDVQLKGGKETRKKRNENI